MFKKLFKIDDSHEFKPVLSEIEDSPSSPLGTFMFWTVVCIFTFLVLWLFFGKVDVVVTSRGKVIPDGEVKILQPLDTGVIRKILVKEGDFVKKGKVLMEIDPSTTEPELESTLKNLNDISLEIQRLKALSAEKSFYPEGGDISSVQVQKELYVSTLNSLNKQIDVKNIELKKTHEEIGSAIAEKSNYESLLDNAIKKKKRLKKVLSFIARDEYDKLQDDIHTYKSNIKKSNYRLNELDEHKKEIKEQINFIKDDFKSKTLEKLAERQKQANQLKAKLDEIKFIKQKQNISAPVDGYIDKLFIHTVGGVVTPAAKIIAITPSNAPLVIKATVLNKDIGFVKEYLPVQIKIDTFSFQKYGLLQGKVKSISKSSIDDEKLGPVYEVYITPLTKKLMVEGKQERISSGMSLSAEIKVGKRRIIEFFIYPLIKYFNESISVR